MNERPGFARPCPERGPPFVAFIEPDMSKRAKPSGKDDHSLVITRILNAPPARVYKAWTEQLADWWGPHGMRTTVTAMDLKPGGAFRTVMRARDGTEYPTRGVFLEVVKNKRIIFTDGYEPGFQPAKSHFLTAVTVFEALPGGKTRYTATALHKSDRDKKAHEKMGFYQGWGECIDKLSELLARP